MGSVPAAERQLEHMPLTKQQHNSVLMLVHHHLVSHHNTGSQAKKTLSLLAWQPIPLKKDVLFIG